MISELFKLSDDPIQDSHRHILPSTDARVRSVFATVDHPPLPASKRGKWHFPMARMLAMAVPIETVSRFDTASNLCITPPEESLRFEWPDIFFTWNGSWLHPEADPRDKSAGIGLRYYDVPAHLTWAPTFYPYNQHLAESEEPVLHSTLILTELGGLALLHDLQTYVHDTETNP